MLASELILSSYQLAGIIDPGEQVDGYYLQTGLNALNLFIADWSQSSRWITFLKEIRVPLISGKHSYTLSKLPGADVDGQPLESIVNAYVMQANVKSPIKWVNTSQDIINNYDNVSGLPGQVYTLQKEFETEMRFYPTPSMTLEAVLIAKQRYAELGAFESIVEIAERARKAFLYQLARDLQTCQLRVTFWAVALRMVRMATKAAGVQPNAS
jgi:hypothetical protein